MRADWFKASWDGHLLCENARAYSVLTWTLDHSSRTMHLSSVNRSKAPVSFVASPVQLVLNLFDVRRIACSECHIIDNDREQQVNEYVSRDVHQFSEHRVPPGANEVRSSQSQSECQEARSASC